MNRRVTLLFSDRSEHETGVFLADAMTGLSWSPEVFLNRRFIVAAGRTHLYIYIAISIISTSPQSSGACAA